jgi:trk system potassium uptake protein TrkH
MKSMNGLFERHRFRKLNQVQYIACGFFLMILIGTGLLLLPCSAREGETTGVLEALFTATSASCVTGLAVYDTYTHWTLFGQLVLLLLIQIGGLGFITIGVGFSIAFRKRIGLRQRDLLKESINAMEIGGIVRLWRSIMQGTFLFEGVGALLLATRFVPEFGWAKGIYYSIFHAVSAFCNAGFDLMGTKEQFSSFVSYKSDTVVNLTLCALIILGSLGFVVWKDVAAHKLHWRQYALHTKLVLSVTAILVVGGAVLMYLFEQNQTLVGMDTKTRILVSLFGSVTTRTAGFNTVDTASLTPASKLLTIVLMFIGGSPGSTAGGVKTTTVAVMIIYIFSNLRNDSGCNVFHRRVGDEVIKKAAMVFGLNLFLGLVSTLILLATSNLTMDDVLFEVFSAISTVGMTTGITRDLNTVGRIVIILLMYCGRVGSMTFALSLIQKPSQQLTRYPVERITIG